MMIMGIRQYKPVTAGRRQGSVSDFADITDRHKKPEKSLLVPRKKKGRRNNLGMSVHNLEMQPGRGGQICRSAGTSATLTAREGHWAQITLPSGEVRRVSSECRATIGALGNADHMNISLGKAGRKRWMGRKPHNRGTSMNPVSHPMGGGEGRTAGGRHPCRPNGVLAKGGKTRKKRKPSNAAIIRRRRPGPHA